MVLQVKKFGEMLERARTATNLSRIDLAKRAGLSEGTVHNTKEGNNIPTQATVQRLLAVSELGLGAEQVARFDVIALGSGDYMQEVRLAPAGSSRGQAACTGCAFFSDRPHVFNSEAAQAAGCKGGATVSRNCAHMAAL